MISWISICHIFRNHPKYVGGTVFHEKPEPRAHSASREGETRAARAKPEPEASREGKARAASERKPQQMKLGNGAEVDEARRW